MARIGGGLICLGSIVVALLFLCGIYLGEPWSYWAIAIPVIIGFLAILVLCFWIGWTMIVTESEISGPQPKEESTSSKTPGTTS